MTAGRLNDQCSGIYGKKAKIHSFPTMYMKGGSSFGRNQSKQGFSQKKNWLKTAFWEDTTLDKVTSEQAGTRNFKSIDTFERFQ